MSANTHTIDLESGSSQSLSASDSASLSVTSDMTIEMWIKLESQPATNATFGLASKYNSTGSQRGFLISYQDASGTKRFSMTTSADGSAVSTGTLNQTLSNATWYHLAFVYDASASSTEVFVDGSSVGTITGLTTSIFDNTASFFIGRDDATGYFDGLIDMVRVWSTKRTGTQITDNMSVEIDSATNLEASWHLNNALTDASGNSNTLTNNNAAVFQTATLPPITLSLSVASLTANGIAPSVDITQTVVMSIANATVNPPVPTVTQVDSGVTNKAKSSVTVTNKAKS